MDFSEMFNKVKNEGKKARRSSWKKDEFLYWVHDLLVHNTPYYPYDIPCIRGSIPAYTYVVEKDDPVATDWEIVKN